MCSFTSLQQEIPVKLKVLIQFIYEHFSYFLFIFIILLLDIKYYVSRYFLSN